MEICKAIQCTGCMVCRNLCLHDAIQVENDSRGFCIPVVDETLCVKCGKCRDGCPVHTMKTGYEMPQVVLAAWSKDSENREQSSSGGIFYLLAKEVIHKGGVVFGVIYDAAREQVCHTKVDCETQLPSLRGSKYVQSDIGLVYQQVQQELRTGRKVLFSGTPCQCAALRNFLRGKQENLILVDLLCHGVPSPMIFSAYLGHMRKAQGDVAICDIQFRNKSPHKRDLFQMQITFASGVVYRKGRSEDMFLRSFLGDYCLRESCYRCQYVGTSRQSDITLGDFWGYQSEQKKYRNNDEGISLVAANTPVGQTLVQQIQPEIISVEKTLAEAVVGNCPLRIATPCAQNTKEFWKTFLQRGSLEDCVPRFLQPVVPSRKHQMRLWIDKHFYLLPNPLKKKYKSMIHRRVEQIRNDYKK